MAEQKGEWARSWPVALGSVGGMMTSAAPVSFTGIVMVPLEKEFGWTRAQISTNGFISAILALLLAPVAGFLIRRYGVRPVALTGFVLGSIGFIFIGLTGPQIWTWYAAWIFYGSVTVVLGPIVWSTATSTVFDKHRGLALSIGLSGSGFAFGVWPPIMALVVEAGSWRETYFLMAAIAMFVMLPLNFFALRVLQKPVRSGPTTVATPVALPGLTFGQAVRTSRFWRFTLALLLAASVNGSMMLHFFPIVSDLEFSAENAAFATAAIGPTMIASRIFSGWLIDRAFAPYIGAGALLLTAVCAFILTLSPGFPAGVAAAICLGIAVGTFTGVHAYVTSRYFGLRDYATIFGVMMGVYGVFFGFVPVLVGHFHDLFGSYQPVLPVMIAMIVPASLLLATLGRYPDLSADGPATA